MKSKDIYWTPLEMDEPVVGDYMATGENCYIPTENDAPLGYLTEQEIREFFGVDDSRTTDNIF